MYYESRKADVTWVRERGFGEFDSGQAAKRGWLIAMGEISGTEYTDKFIDQLYAPFQRMQLTRVGRLPDYPEYQS